MTSAGIHRCQVLVVGGGPAGIAAATVAAEAGRRVALLDENPQPGGQIWRAGLRHGASPGDAEGAWLRRLAASSVQIFPATAAVGRRGERGLLAEGPQGALEFQFDFLILATGARERYLPFPGWTLPNVMGAGGLQAMAAAGLPVAGKNVVVAGGGPLLLAVAAYLRRRGARIRAVCEQSPWNALAALAPALISRPRLMLQAASYRWRLRATPYLAGWWPAAAEGRGKLEAVTVTDGSARRRIDCDFLACGFHLVPNLELPLLLGCRIHAGAVAVDDFQRTSIPHIFCAGEPGGIGGVDRALFTGQIAGLACSGRLREAASLAPRGRRLQRFSAGLERAFRLRDELRKLPPETIVCRCEDTPLESLARFDCWRAAKIHTRCGMGPCQGRVCGPAVEYLFGWKVNSIRPPLYPVPLSTLLFPSANATDNQTIGDGK